MTTNTYAEQIGKLITAVDNLNNNYKTADEVAAIMRDLGIKGRNENSRECVIARHLKSAIGNPDANISVSGYDVVYRMESDGLSSTRALYLNLHGAVSDFINAFDQGAYPEFYETVAETTRPV